MSGAVSCYGRPNSKWGCGGDGISVILTKSNNVVLVPNSADSEL